MKTKLLLMLGMVLLFVERGVGQCPVDTLIIDKLDEGEKKFYSIRIPFNKNSSYNSFSVQNGEYADINNFVEEYISVGGEGLFVNKRTGNPSYIGFENNFNYFFDERKVSLLSTPVFYVMFRDLSDFDKILCTLSVDLGRVLTINSESKVKDALVYDNLSKSFLLNDINFISQAFKYRFTCLASARQIESEINGSSQISVSTFKEGIYLLQIFSFAGEVIYKSKFVINY